MSEALSRNEQADHADHVDPNLFRIEAIHKTYARALVELAEEKGALEEVADQVIELANVLRHEHKLRRLMTSPGLGTQQRNEIIQNIFAGRVHELVLKFLLMLSRKNRLAMAPGIIFAFKGVYDELHGALEVEAYTAHALDEAGTQRIQSSLTQSLGREVVVHAHEDKSLIGGLKLRIGDQLVDATVARRLKGLRNRILDAGRNDARQNFQRLIVEA